MLMMLLPPRKDAPDPAHPGLPAGWLLLWPACLSIDRYGLVSLW
jgi:hypothetical protein